MRFRKGQFVRKLPPYSSVVKAYIKGRDYGVSLQRVHPAPNDMARGSPTCYAIHEGEIFLWPTPTHQTDIRVIYAPPFKVI